MKAKMQKISEKFFLSAAEIDRFSEKTAGLLQQTNVNSKDILRFRLSMENVMDTIGRLIPLFVFICVMNLFMSGGIKCVWGYWFRNCCRHF